MRDTSCNENETSIVSLRSGEPPFVFTMNTATLSKIQSKKVGGSSDIFLLCFGLGRWLFFLLATFQPSSKPCRHDFCYSRYRGIYLRCMGPVFVSSNHRLVSKRVTVPIITFAVLVLLLLLLSQRHGFGFGFANAFSSPLCYSCEYFCDAVARSSFFHPSIRHQTIHRPNRHSRRHRPPLIPPLLSSTVHELPPPLPVRANYFHWKYQGE
jgi:hypothetical protein